MFYPETYDPAWHLREYGFDPAHIPYYESIFTLGNGYLGTRGGLEEDTSNSSPATLIAGLYDKSPEDVTEIANAANWLGVGISIDGQQICLEKSGVVEHERILDLQSGVLYRKSLIQLRPGCQVQIVSRRFVSVEDIHLMGIEYTIRVFDSHPAMKKLSVVCGFDGSVTNEGRKHFAVADCGSLEGGGIFIVQKALHADHTLALGSRITCFKEQTLLSPRVKVKKHAEHVLTDWELDIEANAEYRIEKLVVIYSSRESRDPKTAMAGKIHEGRGVSFCTHLEEHRKGWMKRWENSDIEIAGDGFAQLAVRFSIFHLLQASSKSDDRVSIPAKALTGFGYKGHVFWDTEIFILPYLHIANPLLSRNMLIYRHHTLGEAKKRAKEKGYLGALFAWESADTGEETTPQFVKNMSENRVVRIWSGDSEQHISSDVAYAVWSYFVATGDTEFLLNYGAELLFETARFWSSRAEYNAKTGAYEIKTVIGPDEYHENIDNNYFTNAMAQWNIRKAIEVHARLEKEHAPELDGLSKKIGLNRKELQYWHEVADAMFIHFDEKRNLFVQFDGYMDLEDIALKKYDGRTQPMDVVLGAETVSKSKIAKQADVLMMLTLFRENYSREVKRSNWDFYEPRCGHGSSLSPATHSLLASDLGLPDEAYRYFVQTAGIDLRDKMGNSAHGIHAATAGGLLQAVIYGFAGVRITEEGVITNPRLPRHWEGMKFNLWYRENRIRISIGDTQGTGTG